MVGPASSLLIMMQIYSNSLATHSLRRARSHFVRPSPLALQARADTDGLQRTRLDRPADGCIRHERLYPRSPSFSAISCLRPATLDNDIAEL